MQKTSLFLFFLLSFLIVRSSERDYLMTFKSNQPNNFLTSTSTTPQSFELRDLLFNASSSCFNNISADLTVKLQLENPVAASNLTTNTVIYSVPLKIELWAFGNNSSTPNKTYTTNLDIKYSKALATNANTLISTFHTEGYYKVVISRNTSGAITNTYNAIVNLSAVLSVKRAFSVENFYPDFSLSYIPKFDPNKTYFENQKGDALKITLDNKYYAIALPCSGISDPNDIWQDETDIEWAFVDFNSPTGIYLNSSSSLSSTQLNNLFKNLTFSRVSLPSTSKIFQLPLIYSKGFIVVRTRPVVYTNDRRIEGAWYYYDNNRATGQSSIYLHDGHQQSLNWTSAITFAENAKTRESISYFDGTQRERQSVTISNSENIALVTESLYDFEGRKAISTLPAPSLSNVNVSYLPQLGGGGTSTFVKSIPSNTIKFYDGFSLNNTGGNYNESNFNMHPDPSAGCSIIPTDPMSKTSGASQYYSDNNKMFMTYPNILNPTVKNEYLYRWVPNAQNYPFTQTRYTTDGTNRVAIQSGLGADYKFGSNREIQYFYTNVNSPTELPNLFGTNVGDKQYYTKTYSNDPNGQTNVTYRDAKDRVIATALIGDKPADVEALPGAVASQNYLFIETNRLMKDYQKLTLEGNASHVVPMNFENMNFTLNFSHILRDDDYETSICNPSQLYCADCFYDIDFVAIDKCGIEVPNSKKTLKNYNDNIPINLSCDNNAASPLPSVIENFQLTNLMKGGIDMHAKVKVSEKHADLYTEKYIEELKKCDEFKLQTFIDRNINLIDAFDCIKTCDECNTLKNKSLSEFETKVRKQFKGLIESTPPQLTQTEITALASEMKSKLEVRCKEMCDGAYLTECNFYKESLIRDVSWGGQYCFQFDANGNPDISSATLTSKPNVALAILNNPIFKDASNNTYTNLQDVIKDWKASWADELIKYHPEYCYYEQCIKTQNANKNFKDMIEGVTSYDATVHSRVVSNYYVTNEYMYNSTSITLPLPTGSSPQSNTNLSAYISGANNFNFFASTSTPAPKPLREIAFKMAFFSNPAYSETGSAKYSPSHFFTGSNYMQYCKEDLALFWKMYKTILTSYRDVKRYENMAPSGSCVSYPSPSNPIVTHCCPNQYISCGTQGAAASSNKIDIKLLNKDLIDGFIYTPNCDNSQAKDIVMHFSTQQYTKDNFYGNRRIFPDFKSTITGLISKINSMVAGSTSTTPSSAVVAEFENGKQVNCENAADGWLDELSDCVNKLNLSTTKITELKNNLILVCKKHCGEDPYFQGTKTIDPSSSVTGVTISVNGASFVVKSFQEVLDKYRTSTSPDPFCNSDLVTSLPNFGTGKTKWQFEQKEIFAPKKESCECEMILMWKDKWQSANSNKTFYNYMKDLDVSFSKISPDQLTTLISGCDGTQVACRFLGEDFELPYSFQCSKYYTCFEYAYLKEEFKNKFKTTNWSVLSTTAYQNAFTGYLNTQKGMNLTFEDYDQFEKDCQVCIENDFISKRNLYQKMYNDAVAIFRAGGKKFPYFAKDNLRMLASYFESKIFPPNTSSFLTPKCPTCPLEIAASMASLPSGPISSLRVVGSHAGYDVSFNETFAQISGQWVKTGYANNIVKFTPSSTNPPTEPITVNIEICIGGTCNTSTWTINKPYVPISDRKMMEILCKYFIETNNDFPCCVTDYFNEFVSQKGPVDQYTKSKYLYYQLMRVYINEHRGYNLSLNDYKAILGNCAGIQIMPDYNCCDLNIRWKEYDKLVSDNKTNGMSRCEYLNWIFGEEKNCNETSNPPYTVEYNNCKTSNGNFVNCEKPSVTNQCLPAYKLVFDKYKDFLNNVGIIGISSPNPPPYNFVIDWNWNSNSTGAKNLETYINVALGTNYSWDNIKSILLNMNCHPITDCDIVDYYINKWRGTSYPYPAAIPANKLEDLKTFLRIKLQNNLSANFMTDIWTCSNLVPKNMESTCNRIATIHSRYQSFIGSPTAYPATTEGNLLTSSSDWDAYVDAAVNNINSVSPSLSPAMTKEEFQVIYENYINCTQYNCNFPQKILARFKAKYGITGSFIPPSLTKELNEYLLKLSYNSVSIANLESCNILNFCNMYGGIYDHYKNFLNDPSNKNKQIDWNNPANTTTTHSADIISYINSQLVGNSITLADLRVIFNEYRYKCGKETNQCSEILFYFNRFLAKEGVSFFVDLSPNKYAELASYLNSSLDRNETLPYWTKKLKECDNTIDFCIAYKRIFNEYVAYHVANSTFEINWSSISSSMVSSLQTSTGYLDLTGATIANAFNNMNCVDKFHCALIGHYYARFKATHGSTIASGSNNNSLTNFLAYFNEKFSENLSFKEWLEKWRDCNGSKDIDNYIISCELMKQGIVNILSQNVNKSFEDVIAGNLTSDELNLLNATLPTGRYYTASDWALLFSLCEFNKNCIIVEARVIYFNNQGADNNTCNLINFSSNIIASGYNNGTTGYYFPCWDPSLFEGCELDPPYGIKDINCEELSSIIADFIYKKTDPASYLITSPRTGTQVFNKGLYLEDLRTYLNTYFSVNFPINLSLCDYNTLLETCMPCCYRDFFNKIDYEFVYTLYHGGQRRDFNTISNALYNGTNMNAKELEAMYDDNVLYCTRNQFAKMNLSSDPNKKKYVQSGGGVMGYYITQQRNGYDNIVMNLTNMSPDPAEDLNMSNGIAINLGDGGCSDKSLCTGMPPKKMKKPKCDMSDCDAFIAAWNNAKSRRIFDKHTDFDEWWDAIYWEMIDEIFVEGNYMTKEELMLKLLCCGVDVYEEIVPPCDAEFKSVFDEFVNRFKPNGFPSPDQIRDYFNELYGIDATSDYWITKFSVNPCNLLDPDGGNDCDFFKNNFLYELWDKGGRVQDVVDGMNESYNFDKSSLVDKIIACFSCNELREMFFNIPTFKNFIKELCQCNSDIDVLNYFAARYGCTLIPLDEGKLGCNDFKQKLSSVIAMGSGKIGDVLAGMKPDYDLSMEGLMLFIRTCFNCEDLTIMMQNPVFADLIGRLSAASPYFADFVNGCNGESGSIIPKNEYPQLTYSDRIDTKSIYPQICYRINPSASKLKTIYASKPALKGCPSWARDRFYHRLSKTNFMDIDARKLMSSGEVYASLTAEPAAPPAAPAPPPPYGTSGSKSFNDILGLNIDFSKYQCCYVCDNRLYDKPKFREPKPEPDPCENLSGLAITNAISQYNKVIQAKAKEYKKNFIQKCMDAAKLTVSATANDRQHHYTLYYYDQMGNLIQTVPPAGVRAYTGTTSPNDPPHKLVTQYKYNMDNQVISQESPDGGKSIFIYDELGRLILSQNAKQYPKDFSYTKYDKLSRIVESGEIRNPNYTSSTNFLYQSTVMGIGNQTLAQMYFPNDPHRMPNCNFEQFMNYTKSNANSYYYHVVRTYYDQMNGLTLQPPMNSPSSGVLVENVHHRIAATTLDAIDGDKSGTSYNSALLYSYDMMGNVKKLYAYNGDNSISDVNEKLKTVDYQFDLQSGKVNKVYYQKDRTDQFIHKYEYDGDNRLTDVKSSFDDKIFHREARYTYYLHGPLARVEMGEHRVQGLDYVYTLQGWLKSINGSTLSPGSEPGQDGTQTTITAGAGYCNQAPNLPSVMPANPNYSGVGKDAVALSLDYNQNDYNAISGSNGNIAAKLSTRNLYNGNIVSMKVSNMGLENITLGQPATMGYSYTYDQLHRIVAMDAFKGTANTATADYKENISYDASGNILSYKRNKDNHTTGTTPSLDDLSYKYYYINSAGQKVSTGTPSPTDKLTNQLAQVSDAIGAPVLTTGSKDIGNQTSASNYQYDALGNLIHDDQEGMDITWNPAGKISTIVIDKSGTVNDKTISFAYDPLGQRITKMVNDASGLKYTYYRRDASGNLLATNEQTSTSVGDGAVTNAYSLSEYIVYGSARLGVKRPRKCFNYAIGGNMPPINNNQFVYSDEYFSQAQVSFSANAGCSSATDNNYSEDHYQEFGFNNSLLFGSALYVPKTKARIISYKSSLTEYEIANHLGNVLATLKDELWYKETCSGSGWNTCCYTTREPIILSATDYYPYGMPMPNRTYSVGGMKNYRFGFNTQEKDDEVYGEGNLMSAHYWEYDVRIGRRWNLDPIYNAYESRYLVNGDNPIWYNDPDGDAKLNNVIIKAKRLSWFQKQMRKLSRLIQSEINREPEPINYSFSAPSPGAYADGAGEFGKRGDKLKVSTTELKSTGKIKYYTNGWLGNQHIKTTAVYNKKLTKSLAKHMPVIGHILDAKDIAQGIRKDGYNIGENTAVEVAGAIGGAGGAWAGAAAGAAFGTMIFPGPGTVIGGAVGAFAGSWAGEEGAKFGATQAIKAYKKE